MVDFYKIYKSYKIYKLALLEEGAEAEGQEVGDGVEFAVEADVFVAKLDAEFDVGDVAVGEFIERLGGAIGGFDLHGDQGFHRANHEIHLNGWFVVAIII